jgi:hypothetical protein
MVIIAVLLGELKELSHKKYKHAVIFDVIYKIIPIKLHFRNLTGIICTY